MFQVQRTWSIARRCFAPLAQHRKALFSKCTLACIFMHLMLASLQAFPPFSFGVVHCRLGNAPPRVKHCCLANLENSLENSNVITPSPAVFFAVLLLGHRIATPRQKTRGAFPLLAQLHRMQDATRLSNACRTIKAQSCRDLLQPGARTAQHCIRVLVLTFAKIYGIVSRPGPVPGSPLCYCAASLNALALVVFLF